MEAGVSRATRALDLVLAALLLAGGAALLVPLGLLLRATAPLARLLRRERRILYLGTGQIAQVFPRNGTNLFLERETSDFRGFFAHLWNVHFPAGSRGVLDLTPRHHLVDFDVPIPAWLGPYHRAAMALREVLFLAWLGWFARKHGISMVTGTNPYLQGLNALLLSRLVGIPYGVIITRDFDWDWREMGKQAFPSIFPSRAIEKAVEGVVLRRADLVLADRAFYATFALRNGAAPERTATTRVLADEAYAHARCSPTRIRGQFGVSAEAPLLVYVGRLDPDKMALDLVECLARVRKRFPSAVLLCAGTGRLIESMRDRAAGLGINDGLLLPGAIPLDLLPDLIASADVVAAPHMGYTLVEAGLTGTPIVTYDYDYHGELVRDGATGYLAPFRDVEALADRVCQALADPPQSRAAGARLRALLLREHSLDAVIPLYRAAYARALSGQS